MNETMTVKAYPSSLKSPQYSSAKIGEQNKKTKSNFNGKTVSMKSNELNPNEPKDKLLNYPLRLCAYTNEVGAAVSPIPVIGPKLFALSWVPALMYFGADIYDKYSKGENNDYSASSNSRAIKQTIFQGLASVIMPTAAVILGQNVASKLSGYGQKNGMDIRAKEEILAELRRDLNQDKLRQFRKEFNEIIAENPTKSMKEIKELDRIKEIKKEIGKAIYEDLKSESQTIQNAKKNLPLFKRLMQKLHSKSDFKHLPKVPMEKFDDLIKPYVEKHLSDLVDLRLDLQKAINKDGTLNQHASSLDPKVIKKVKTLLKNNIANRDIVDKSSFVIKETLLSNIHSTLLKLSMVKIVGGFLFLAALAHPIDKFVEKIVIEKGVDPALKKFSKENK